MDRGGLEAAPFSSDWMIGEMCHCLKQSGLAEVDWLKVAFVRKGSLAAEIRADIGRLLLVEKPTQFSKMRTL